MSEINFVLYDKVSGKIECSGLTDETVLDTYVTERLVYIESEAIDGQAFYIDVATKEPIERPGMGLTISSLAVHVLTAVVISNVPVGTKFQHEDGEDIIDDGLLEWSSNVAGLQIFHLTNFPYQEEYIHVQILP